MASTLCCTAEQEGRCDSPELPNARVSQPTPASRPLLPKLTVSPSSRSASAQSGHLRELRDIFDHARDDVDEGASLARVPRSRFSRPSMQSLGSLHTMASLRSVIKRKFSRDLSHKTPAAPQVHSKPKNRTIDEEPPTMIKQSKLASNQQLKIIKGDLHKDLLSDTNPEEGGYDSDAQMLDDIARHVGKKTPNKRPSIHSVDWSPSTGSKPTPGSSTKGRGSAELTRNIHPYHIENPQPISFTNRFSQVFSTPNLRKKTPSAKDHKLNRSHSAASMGLPKPSPLSPLTLPSLSTCESDGIPWSETMSKSLHLSQFPVPPRYIGPDASETELRNVQSLGDGVPYAASRDTSAALSVQVQENPGSPAAHAIEIRLQHATASPRASTSVRAILPENASPGSERQVPHAKEDDKEDDPRRSVHLCSMRISHHLRSGSLLSWDQLADAPDVSTPSRPFRERTVSDQTGHSRMQNQSARCDRQTSSSGFASTKVPLRWGKVLPNDHDLGPDVASSIYSSRPQSPPDSTRDSMMDLSRNASKQHTFSTSSINVKKPRRSHSFPTDDEETPRPEQRQGMMSMIYPEPSSKDSALTAPRALARKNSVAETKTSKFREEFSPSPPKRRLPPSASIIKLLNPKRLSMRSQSEANLSPNFPDLAVDGVFDTLAVPADRERRQSRSLMSLQTEQDALGKDKGADHVWDRALQAHQEEKASLFLSKNKDQALHVSPFRERSGSIAARRASFDHGPDSLPLTQSQVRHVSSPLINPFAADQHAPNPSSSRRSALANWRGFNTEQDISIAFEAQGDDTDIVGAWGRYPSHTRHDRTVSVGKVDRVETRDFALEAAIKFASNQKASHDDDMIDPTERLPSPPLLPGQKRRKKKVGSGRMAKSNSMTFGKALMKNYTSMFKSQSAEFRRHGRGHRSSITSGGILEFPELELLPSVWDGNDIAGTRVDARKADQLDGQAARRGRLPIEDSMATLRPRRNSSAPNLNDFSFRQNDEDNEQGRDRARVWSVYYENCVPSFPRLSTDADSSLEGLGRPSRLSFDGKRASMHSHTMPNRASKHLRNASQLSRLSISSQGSMPPSFTSLVQDAGAGDEKSVVSVRRSTMDLISKFKQQEATEHAALSGREEMNIMAA